MITDGLAVFFLMHVGEIFVGLANRVYHVPRIIEGSVVEKGVAFIGKSFVVPANDDTVGGGNNGRAIAATERGTTSPRVSPFGGGDGMYLDDIEPQSREGGLLDMTAPYYLPQAL